MFNLISKVRHDKIIVSNYILDLITDKAYNIIKGVRYLNKII